MFSGLIIGEDYFPHSHLWLPVVLWLSNIILKWSLALITISHPKYRKRKQVASQKKSNKQHMSIEVYRASLSYPEREQAWRSAHWSLKYRNLISGEQGSKHQRELLRTCCVLRRKCQTWDPSYSYLSLRVLNLFFNNNNEKHWLSVVWLGKKTDCLGFVLLCFVLSENV